MYKKFEKLLNERGLTAYRVAKDTGLTTVMFSEWKKGKANPKADKLLILSRYFGVPMEYFLEAEEETV